jgi:hypothetical protein
VPEDVALAGFDDIPIARYVAPALTTIRVPIAALGAAALEMLAKGVEAPGSRPPCPPPCRWNWSCAAPAAPARPCSPLHSGPQPHRRRTEPRAGTDEADPDDKPKSHKAHNPGDPDMNASSFRRHALASAAVLALALAGSAHAQLSTSTIQGQVAQGQVPAQAGWPWWPSTRPTATATARRRWPTAATCWPACPGLVRTARG